jgi:two-component system, cell cycle response regulator
MLLDVDHFKTINDRFGHAAGDDVLREIARRMAGQIRGSDISARFGGEEFAILMPNTTLEDACTVAERIRHTVASATFTVSGLATPDGRRTQTVAVTISIGLAACRGKDKGEGRGAVVEATARQLVAAADRALYRAKAAGRNTVVAADREIPDDID